MKIDFLPFHIGPTVSPHNPLGLPDTWPFSCGYDSSIGAIVQYPTSELIDLLERTYRVGQLVGTPLAEDRSGKLYADDFLAFIDKSCAERGQTALEIGAGVGYVTRRLLDSGWQAIGLEPGRGYEDHWRYYGIDIINEFFPSSYASGPFDLICSYAVLEHIADPIKFLEEIRERLAPDGTAVFSVPDCTAEIQAGDPAMLLHEHFTYFNAETLADMLWRAGFSVKVCKSGYGRCIYAAAKHRKSGDKPFTRSDLDILQSYSERTLKFIAKVQKRFEKMLSCGTVGVYCAARGLAILDPSMQLRFFDDDEVQQGKYLPPFLASIEVRQSLLANPVDTLMIMSRTFGYNIQKSLRHQKYQGQIILSEEV